MQLIYGDCLEKMKDIPDKSIDMVLTDIPYNEVNRKSNGLRNLNKGIADSTEFDINKMLDEFCRICAGSIYIFCGIEQISLIRQYLRLNGLSTRLCIWEKSNPSPMNGQNVWLSGIECCVYGKFPKATFNEHCKNVVWRYASAHGKLHPTMKPLNLMEYVIKASSKEGDIICDPFMGSGSTGVACINTNRDFIGIEKDEDYFLIAKQRIKEAMKDHM